MEEIVRFENASIALNGSPILEQVNFSLVRGEFCYISGKTGTGKSTFLKALYGAAQITDGNAVVLDQDLRLLDPHSRPFFRRKLGMIFQDDLLFRDETVFANLDFVLKAIDWNDAKERAKRIDELLSALNLTESKDDLVGNLSAGQRRKISIARAMLNRPSIILADEPTGNLDGEEADTFMRLMYSLAMAYRCSLVLCTYQQNLIENWPARTYQCWDNSLVEL